MPFTSSKKSITLEVSLPADIVDYINSLVLELNEKESDNKADPTILSLFTTLIENLYLNRYKKLLTKLYLGKILVI